MRGRKKLTTEEFIYNSRQVHRNKYDYSKVQYIDTKTKVTIICPIHGEFNMNPANHTIKNKDVLNVEWIKEVKNYL